jgi:SnoaL-like domain
MKPYPASFDRMLAAWNERDVALIRSHLDQALAADVEFIDPTIVTRGVDEFDANIRGFRGKYPHADCVRTSGVDTHHDLHRYSWHIVVGQQVVVAGFDVVETDAEGRVRRVLGFFGPLPALSA